MDGTKRSFVRIAQEKNLDYTSFFKQQNHLGNYIDFALRYTMPEIWVDSIERPCVGIMFAPPAVILQGDPNAGDIPPIFNIVPKDSWMVPTNEEWEQRLATHFEGGFEIQNRTSFDHTSLSLAHLQTLKKDLPAGLRLIRVGEKQAKDTEGILYQRDLQYFFASADFMQCGLGFCILDEEQIVAYAVSNFPLLDNVLEVSIRVANDEKYRGKGLGQAVSIALLEYCLQHNIEPHWDAANETSAHIALKLGYRLNKKWRMYHILEE
ncbi:MAG TPA: GNAT family N-acetyltransferase [Anaerolineaceae bacterium]|nr:GNAT family N-acetyltransferase [Anaerolineaceae bacterium]